MLLFWSNLIVAGKVMWLERWEGSDLAKWEVWESGKAGKLEEWQAGKGGRRAKLEKWEGPDFIQGLGVQGESKTSCSCFWY